MGDIQRWVGRLAAAAATAAVVLLLQTQAALADPGGYGSLGQTPPALSWIKLTDTHGISIWNFEMSLNRGGVTDPGKFFWSSVVDTYWGSYRSGCALALWFLDWVMSFDWLHIIASPLLSTGAAMQSVVDRIGIVPTLLTIAAVVAVGWMAKGRYATGIWELAMSLLIATLASGVFAQPVQLVAGPDGLIMKAQRAGLELAGELSGGQSGGTSDPVQLRTQLTGQMVDTFVREPAQMINFGQVLDGGKCGRAYDDVVRGGPYGQDDNIRNRVNGCDSKLGDYADSPSAGMATGALMFEPASGIILLLVVVLAGSVIAAACYAMFQSLKAIVTLVTGLLPGGSRGSLFMTVAETAISLLIIVFTNVFLGVFLMVIQALFKDSSGSSKPRTFVILDVLLLVAIGVFWRYRQRLKGSAERLAQWMSQRPGGGQATRLPERGAGLGPWAGKALTATSQLSMVRSRRTPQGGAGSVYNVDARRQAVGFFGLGGGADDNGSGSVDIQPPPPSGGPSLPSTPIAGPPGGSPLARIEARQSTAGRVLVGTLARAGTKAALTAATGGASTAVTGALTATKVSKALTTARRAAVVGQLALPAGPSSTAAAQALPSGQPGPARPLPVTPTRPVLPAGPRQRPQLATAEQPRTVTSRLSTATATASKESKETGVATAATPGRTPDTKAGGAGRPDTSTPTAALSQPSRPSTATTSEETGVAIAATPGRTLDTKASGAGRPDASTPTAALSQPSAGAPTARSHPGSRSAGMRRQWDKVVRDGQVVLVPRTPPPAPSAADEPSATRRPGRPDRSG